MAKQYKVKLLRKEKIANNTWLFVFEKPEEYIFIPGQYQTFILKLPNGKIDWRDMTITSSPSHNELWMVTKVSENPSLFKKALFALSIGETVDLEGPNGGFIIRENKRPHVFLAGGIGVNVFHSMIRSVVENKLSTPITLLASFSKKEDIIFYEELKQLENEKIKVIYTLTKEKNWDGEKGRITEKMIKKYTKDITNPIFMIAGSVEMVDDINNMLLSMNIPMESIKIDYFTGY